MKTSDRHLPVPASIARVHCLSFCRRLVTDVSQDIALGHGRGVSNSNRPGAGGDGRGWEGRSNSINSSNSGSRGGMNGARQQQQQGRSGWGGGKPQEQARTNGSNNSANDYNNNTNGYDNSNNGYNNSTKSYNKNANGYNNNTNGYNNSINGYNSNANGYNNNAESRGVFGDEEGASSSMRGQGVPIAPRLPNGSGLVRKRKFVPPGRLDSNNSNGNNIGGKSCASGGGNKFPGSAALGRGSNGGNGGNDGNSGNGGGNEIGRGGGGDELPEELQHLDKAMVDKIMQEIQQRGDPVTFDQIAGLELAKKSVVELVCWPMARPDIFTGLRSLPKGLLLFGPPGTGGW